MPKISKNGCYSNRHLRRLRYNQTKLELEGQFCENFTPKPISNETDDLIYLVIAIHKFLLKMMMISVFKHHVFQIKIMIILIYI